LESTKEIYDTNRERLHLRLKSLHHKVVSGTENIVKLFQGKNRAKNPDNITISHEISISDRTNTPTPDPSDIMILVEKDKTDESRSANTYLEDGSLQQLQPQNTTNNPKHQTFNPMWFALFFCILIILLIYFIIGT